MAKKVLTQYVSEPLNGAKTAKIDINPGDGNLTIDCISGGEPLLASGTLQYLEKQGPPTRAVITSGAQATLSLKAGSGQQTWLRLPWAACNGATDWQVNLNPGIPSDLTAHSAGGNMRLNLAGMAITRVTADTGGGNMEVILPERASSLHVKVKTGGGNVSVEVGSGTSGKSAIEAGSGAGKVVVRVPGGLPARIYATSGLGKVIIDPRFARIDKNTYQSDGYDSAADRLEITLSSGAGDVSVSAG